MHSFNPLEILKLLPALLIWLTVHEFAHAYVAMRCGDNTAKNDGRITFNPLKHIDPLGFFLIIFAWFGWAKPVMFNPYNLRDKEIDPIKIALAGPISNAILAILFSIIYVFILRFLPNQEWIVWDFFMEIIVYWIFINWGLFVFNLIPIPPLDGSHLLLYYFKDNITAHNNIYKYWSIVLFAIIIIQSQIGFSILPIGVIVKFLSWWTFDILSKIFGA